MSEYCLTLLCSPDSEETMQDLLLLSPHAGIFTTSAVAAHGMHFGELSQMEQVLGQAQAVQVQVLCTIEGKSALLEELRRRMPNAGIRYWVTQVSETGEIA